MTHRLSTPSLLIQDFANMKNMKQPVSQSQIQRDPQGQILPAVSRPKQTVSEDADQKKSSLNSTVDTVGDGLSWLSTLLGIF